MEVKGKNVLLTGGYGFLGSYVYDKLLKLGANPFRFHSQQYNLEDPGDTQRAFAKFRPHAVIHMAGKCGGIAANKANPATMAYSNLLLGLNVLEACKEFGVYKVVNISSACAYPKHTLIPFREENLWMGLPEDTNLPYGIAKRTMLIVAEAYRQQHNLNVVNLVLTNVYGPGEKTDDSGHAIGSIIRKLQAAKDEGRKSATLWGTGTPTRDYLYVEDAADAILAALAKYDGSLSLNIGSGQDVSILSVAMLAAKYLNYDGDITWDHSMPDGQARRCLDVSRAERLLGWKASTSFSVGLRRTVAWYQKQRVPA